jgi:hypothetical protein
VIVASVHECIKISVVPIEIPHGGTGVASGTEMISIPVILRIERARIANRRKAVAINIVVRIRWERIASIALRYTPARETQYTFSALRETTEK